MLAEALEAARSGTGSLVLVSGEAGIGKTSLVEAFINDVDVRTFWGACDDLITPRPLDPFHDIARQSGGELATLLESDVPPNTLFTAVLDEFDRGPGPTVVVLEDAHWADAATLDMIRFIGRRIDRVQAVLIVTSREDEIEPEHGLRFVVGDLPASAVHRMPLAPLSPAAVAALAGTRAKDVYEITGGNPFFVSELIGGAEALVPVTVRDAVLARVARVSRAARRVIDLVSIVPSRTELTVLHGLLGEVTDELEECERRGILVVGEQAVWFRHELARQAVEESLPAARRRALNRDVLSKKKEGAADPAVLVHHAEQAGDIDMLMEAAPAAARRAAAGGVAAGGDHAFPESASPSRPAQAGRAGGHPRRPRRFGVSGQSGRRRSRIPPTLFGHPPGDRGRRVGGTVAAVDLSGFMVVGAQGGCGSRRSGGDRGPGDTPSQPPLGHGL